MRLQDIIKRLKAEKHWQSPTTVTIASATLYNEIKGIQAELLNLEFEYANNARVLQELICVELELQGLPVQLVHETRDSECQCNTQE